MGRTLPQGSSLKLSRGFNPLDSVVIEASKLPFLKILNKVHDGVAIPVNVIDESELHFKDIPTRIDTGRYHSRGIDKDTMPKELIITATDDVGEVMAIRHQHFDVCGVQFHPESLLTPKGIKVIENWVKLFRLTRTG